MPLQLTKLKHEGEEECNRLYFFKNSKFKIRTQFQEGSLIALRKEF